MNAMERLREADPVPDAGAFDSRAPQARALLDRIIAEPPVAQRNRRRLVLGIAGAAVAAAVAAFFVVDPAAAYTVDKNADGSVAVTFRADRLKNPAKLNAELARAGARTVLIRMVPANRCSEQLDQDPAFPFRSYATQEDLDRYPVSYQPLSDGVRITIRPEKMPAGDTLAFGFFLGGHDTIVVPAVVRTLPSCMAIPNRWPPVK